jgi:hypothetical protein
MIVAIFWRVTLLSVPVNAATKYDSCRCRLCISAFEYERRAHRKNTT